MKTIFAAPFAVPFVTLVVLAAPVAFATDKDKPAPMAQAADKKPAGEKSAEKSADKHSDKQTDKSPDKKTAEKGTAPATRNWAAADANKDNLISPEEMEAYLKANPGPLKGK